MPVPPSPATSDAPDDRPGADGPDRSERAERARRAARATSGRARRIDETLTRLTAAHAGLSLPGRADEDRDQDRTPVASRWWRRRPGAGKPAVAALALLVFVATTFGWAAKEWLGSAVADAAALDLESGAIVDVAAQAGDENVLIVASDPDGRENRADTVTVAHIPDGGGPLVVLSFPADLEINRPPCERWDADSATYRNETVPAQARTQLRSAVDVGGPRCTTRVVQQLSGLAITQYLGVNVGALGPVAIALGGVEICAPAPVLDAVLGPVAPDPGVITLDAMRATDYARAGDVRGDATPDRGRVERQQRLLAGVLDTALSVPALLDLGGLAELRPALGAAMVADETGLDEALALALSLRRLDAEGVVAVPVPTTATANSRGHSVLRAGEAAALFAAVRTDGPLPEPTADARAAGPEPSDVTVQVLNGSDRTGIAGEVGHTLRSLGFVIGEVGNTEEPAAQTVIRFSPDQADAAALLATTVPSATAVPDPRATGVLQLVLGRSFDDVVRAPAEPGPGSVAATDRPVATCP